MVSTAKEEVRETETVNVGELRVNVGERSAAVLPRVVFCISAAGTLCSHEVGEVPDEFTYNIVLPLLVKNAVVVPQHFVLVLLSKHH